MDKIKNIAEILWNIVKITFMLLLFLIGIKLILALLFPMILFPFNAFLYPQSNSFDWNPIATIIGAIITGLIAWFAIFKTSELDRDSRKFEAKYKLYQDKLLELNENIIYLRQLNWIFKIDDDGTPNIAIEVNKIDNVYKTRTIKYLLESLAIFSKEWENKQEFIKTIDDLINIQCFFSKQIVEHKFGLEGHDEFIKPFIRSIDEVLGKEHVNYNIQGFLDAYKENSEKAFNFKEKDIIFDEMQDFINNEFKLDNK